MGFMLVGAAIVTVLVALGVYWVVTNITIKSNKENGEKD